jgi:hypothetical protein
MNLTEMSQVELSNLVEKQTELIANLNKTIEGKDAIIAEKEDIIEDLQIKLTGRSLRKQAINEKPTLPKIPVIIDGEKWKWVVPSFNLNGKRYTAAEACFDEKILKEIIQTPGQNTLRRIF